MDLDEEVEKRNQRMDSEFKAKLQVEEFTEHTDKQLLGKYYTPDIIKTGFCQLVRKHIFQYSTTGFRHFFRQVSVVFERYCYILMTESLLCIFLWHISFCKHSSVSVAKGVKREIFIAEFVVDDGRCMLHRSRLNIRAIFSYKQ